MSMHFLGDILRHKGGISLFNSVLYVRNVCKQRKIPISQLEKDCGFSNGYLNPKKIAKIPYDRAKIISDYLEISIEMILGEPQTEKTPAENGERKYDDSEILFALSRGGESAITEAMYREVLNFAHYVAQREANLKTPGK